MPWPQASPTGFLASRRIRPDNHLPGRPANCSFLSLNYDVIIHKIAASIVGNTLILHNFFPSVPFWGSHPTIITPRGLPTELRTKSGFPVPCFVIQKPIGLKGAHKLLLLTCYYNENVLSFVTFFDGGVRK